MEKKNNNQTDWGDVIISVALIAAVVIIYALSVLS